MTHLRRLNKKPSTSINVRKQFGLALVIVMLFLSAITAISIWAVRQSLLGEGMARNQLDSEVARQAAEAALRDAERDIMNLTPGTLANASCSRNLLTPPLGMQGFTQTCDKGLCEISNDTYATASWSAASGPKEPWWPGGQWNNNIANKPSRVPVTSSNCASFTGGVPLGTYTGAAPILGVFRQPEYMIEYFNRVSNSALKPTAHYRITARGFGYVERTQIVLQTIYVPLQEP